MTAASARAALRQRATHRLVLIAALALLGACAAPHDDGGFQAAWAQRPEERGRLPVGRVVSVERLGSRDEPLSLPASAGVVPGAGVAAVTAGVVSHTTGNPGQIHRHTLELNGGETRRVDVGYPFKVGDCVAIRVGSAASSAALVSALDGECG
jgi:hypothetical protein